MAIEHPDHAPDAGFVSVEDFAVMVEVNKRTIYRMVERGQICHLRLGDAIRIPADEVQHQLRIAGA